ncbi:hypothetical protein BV898_03700 [Hypsibius exemplaris]|uniref:Uncharacterized protein n=1 Tax=Hypsibius exemplaris TaxID=2072580 RepID=A0A1W0X4T7_HYPEX|nr:hypothetical protein BV898_03700 [Hypsibius exemplaris]
MDAGEARRRAGVSKPSDSDRDDRSIRTVDGFARKLESRVGRWTISLKRRYSSRKTDGLTGCQTLSVPSWMFRRRSGKVDGFVRENGLVGRRHGLVALVAVTNPVP